MPVARRALADWAEGDRDRVAVVHLLTAALGGQLAEDSAPWVRVEADGRRWLDPERLRPSGDEASSVQRVLAVAQSLYSGEPVDLRWALSDFDAATSHAVAEALSIAAGCPLVKPA